MDIKREAFVIGFVKYAEEKAPGGSPIWKQLGSYIYDAFMKPTTAGHHATRAGLGAGAGFLGSKLFGLDPLWGTVAGAGLGGASHWAMPHLQQAWRHYFPAQKKQTQGTGAPSQPRKPAGRTAVVRRDPQSQDDVFMRGLRRLWSLLPEGDIRAEGIKHLYTYLYT